MRDKNTNSQTPKKQNLMIKDEAQKLNISLTKNRPFSTS
jgi:hypothetical protein